MANEIYTKEDVIHQLVHQTEQNLHTLAQSLAQLTITGNGNDMRRLFLLLDHMQKQINEYTTDPAKYYEAHK